MNGKKIGIICPSSIIAHHNDYALLVYCVAQAHLRFNDGRKLITPDIIAYEIDKTMPPLQYRKKKRIIDALDDLCDMGFAEATGCGYYYLIDTNLFYNQTDTYERIGFHEYNKLKGDAGLLKHYVLIKKGLIDGVCTFPATYFAEKEEVSTQTISRRNNVLKELELINIHQAPGNAPGEYGRNHYTLFKKPTNEDLDLFG